MSKSNISQIPKDWMMRPIDELMCIDANQITSSAKSFNSLPFLGLENIESHSRQFVISTENIDTGRSACWQFGKQHVLYGKLRPYLNKVYLSEQEGRCSLEIIPLLPRNGFNREFVAAILQSPTVVSFAVKHSTGGRMPRADIKKLMNFQISTPRDIESCNALGVMLSDKLKYILTMRAAAERQVKAAEAFNIQMLREYFTFKEIPRNWRIVKLGGKNGITKIVNGSTPSSGESRYWDGNILWATPSDVGNISDIFLNDTERKITEEGYNSCSTTIVPAGTILLTSRAPVGNIAIAGKPMCTNQGFKSLVPKAEIDSLYLYFAVQAIMPKIKKMGHGNTFDEITKPMVEKLLIPIPESTIEQKRIATAIHCKWLHCLNLSTRTHQQHEAISALPSAALREFFNFGKGNNA